MIKEIAALKANNNQLYPEGLETLINELTQIVEKLRGVVDCLLTCVKQLTALIKLHKSIEPMFISWRVEKMSEASRVVAEAYEQEFKVYFCFTFVSVVS